MGKSTFEIGAFLGSTAYTGHSLSSGSTAWEIGIALMMALVGCCPLIVRWADAFSGFSGETPYGDTPDADGRESVN